MRTITQQSNPENPLIRKIGVQTIAAALVLALVFTFSCSSDSDDRDDSGSIAPVSKFVAEPYIGSGRIADKIKYSYSYDGYDFYYIYLGELKNVPLFSHPAQHHNGMNSTYKVEATETIKNSTAETITNSKQTTINIVDEYTKTVDVKASQEINAKFPIKMFKTEVKVAAEEHWNEHINKSSEFRETTSLTNTISRGTEYTKTTMTSRSWDFTSSEKAGYYRYTLFSTSDVYLYVIKDSKTGDIDYEFREYVIPSTYFWQLDYSETSSFGKSDATSFEFDVTMLDYLPRPLLTLTETTTTPQEKKTLIKEFITAGDTTFNLNFPAMVEIYALGAGGGGQGGNSRTGTFLPSNYYYGTGGAGGGGAAVYTKVYVNTTTTFSINVGKGGNAGKVHRITNGDAGKTGYSGSNGGNSSVKWGSFIIIAQGGNGGNQPNNNDRETSGGAGGSIAYVVYPIGYVDGTAIKGNDGSFGALDGLSGSNGGRAAQINTGSLDLFGGGLGAVRCSSCWYTGEFLDSDDGSRQAESGGGGAGGYGEPGSRAKASSNDGSPGGNGKIIIIITEL